MSARAFPNTLDPSPVRLSVRLSVSICLLDYFLKPISSYSLNQIFYTDIKYDITNLACAFFLTIGSFLNFRRIFEIMVWYIVNVKCKCKMQQLSLDCFEIIQGSSIEYNHNGICFLAHCHLGL